MLLTHQTAKLQKDTKSNSETSEETDHNFGPDSLISLKKYS